MKLGLFLMSIIRSNFIAVERRYKAGITNLFHIYLPLVDAWLIYDNSDSEPDYIASKDQDGTYKIKNVVKWQQLNQAQ